ncbi:hypothetical protein FJZ18_01215 [Candidatus Pacearchaeota archaeon]|nr:hypothetical protein [Candidatus Pacearchaeota archaeon]
MSKDITSHYYEKLCKTFDKWRLGGEQTHIICFHLSELAEFSSKYKRIIDDIIKQPTKKMFLKKLEYFHGVLMERHEVNYHLIPADNFLSAWFKKLEDL